MSIMLLMINLICSGEKEWKEEIENFLSDIFGMGGRGICCAARIMDHCWSKFKDELEKDPEKLERFKIFMTEYFSKYLENNTDFIEYCFDKFKKNHKGPYIFEEIYLKQNERED